MSKPPSIPHPAVLESRGGGGCPVQHWGTFTNGWKFYFRFRYNSARLNVAPPGTPTYEVPDYNPTWSFEDFAAACDAGEEYAVPRCLWPEGYLDEVYPQDPLVGFFATEEDLLKTFTACLQQVQEEIGLG